MSHKGNLIQLHDVVSFWFRTTGTSFVLIVTLNFQDNEVSKVIIAYITATDLSRKLDCRME